jgi:hypothetical protein
MRRQASVRLRGQAAAIEPGRAPCSPGEFAGDLDLALVVARRDKSLTTRALTTRFPARDRPVELRCRYGPRFNARGAKFPRESADRLQTKSFPHFPQARRRFLPSVEKPTDSTGKRGRLSGRPLPPWGFDAAGNPLLAWGA